VADAARRGARRPGFWRVLLDWALVTDQVTRRVKPLLTSPPRGNPSAGRPAPSLVPARRAIPRGRGPRTRPTESDPAIRSRSNAWPHSPHCRQTDARRAPPPQGQARRGPAPLPPPYNDGSPRVMRGMAPSRAARPPVRGRDSALAPRLTRGSGSSPPGRPDALALGPAPRPDSGTSSRPTRPLLSSVHSPDRPPALTFTSCLTFGRRPGTGLVFVLTADVEHPSAPEMACGASACWTTTAMFGSMSTACGVVRSPRPRPPPATIAFRNKGNGAPRTFRRCWHRRTARRLRPRRRRR
jgi:hypothetical protein